MEKDSILESKNVTSKFEQLPFHILSDYCFKSNLILLISFFAYGRFIEINWFKRSQNSRKLIANSNRMQWSMRENRKRTKKKDTRGYAKTAYGSINHLIAVLSNDFSDSERDYLKQLLEMRYESKNWSPAAGDHYQ